MKCSSDENCGTTLLLCRLSVVLGLLSGVVISWPLFFGKRVYPKVPLFDFISDLNPSWDPIVASIFVASAVAIFIPSYEKIGSILVLATGIILCLFDQGRLQPWLYIYFFFLLGQAIIPARSFVKENVESVLDTFRFILGFVYFWSGISKLGWAFLVEAFPWIIGDFQKYTGEDLFPLILLSGMLVAPIECLIGISLFTKKYRKPGAISAVAMHFLILLVVGPMGKNYNQVIWPWNMTMICLMYVLILRPVQSSSVLTNLSLVNFRFVLYRTITVLFLGILPLLHYVDLWDSYPSFSLYSGRLLDVKVILPRDVAEENSILFSGVEFDKSSDSDAYEFYISNWSLAVTHVPAYPEKRVLLKVIDYLCRRDVHRELKFVIARQYEFRRRDATPKSCQQLQSL